MRPFYIYKTFRGIYYVQFSNELTGKRSSPRSTSQRSYNAALKIACDWLQNGIPTPNGSKPIQRVATVQAFLDLIQGGKLEAEDLERIQQAMAFQGFVISSKNKPEAQSRQKQKTPLVSFLDNFWDYETSPHIQDKLIHKQRIGKRHCYDSRNRVSYWRMYFTESKYLEEVTTQE